MRLPKRLTAIAELVPAGSRVCDVGTDHGLIPAWLVLNGVCPGAIASDVSANCLRRADETARSNGVADKIAFRLTDGLDGIDPELWDTLIVAGMAARRLLRFSVR